MVAGPDLTGEHPFLSESEIAEIKARCDRATPGPWKSWIEKIDIISGSDFIETSGDDIYITGARKEDQDFIAHARQDVPRLLMEIERLNILLEKCLKC